MACQDIEVTELEESVVRELDRAIKHYKGIVIKHDNKRAIMVDKVVTYCYCFHFPNSRITMRSMAVYILKGLKIE